MSRPHFHACPPDVSAFLNRCFIKSIYAWLCRPSPFLLKEGYVCVGVYVHVHLHADLCVCKHVYMCVHTDCAPCSSCVYVLLIKLSLMYIYIYIYVYIYTYIYIYSQKTRGLSVNFSCLHINPPPIQLLRTEHKISNKRLKRLESHFTAELHHYIHGLSFNLLYVVWLNCC